MFVMPVDVLEAGCPVADVPATNSDPMIRETTAINLSARMDRSSPGICRQSLGPTRHHFFGTEPTLRESTAVQTEIPEAKPFDLSTNVVGLDRHTGAACFMVRDRPGPPVRLDGHTVGMSAVGGEELHGGEMHPDGDELLLVIDGRLRLLLELDSGERVVDVDAGNAVVVPKGTWHRILRGEPAHIVNITPGPNGPHRPKPIDNGA
jgi:mannose-6-phosphate isomerase-like protein (cupin superfamily)